MKNFVKIFIILYIFSGITNAATFELPQFANKYSPENVKYYTEYWNNVQKWRALIYNALNLCPEQVEFFEQIIKQDNEIYDKKFSQLIIESYKLQALKEAKAPRTEIASQKHIDKKIENEIEQISKTEDKNLKKNLHHLQISKYSMIKKLARDDLKRGYRKKDYYKSNPCLPKFGNPVNQ